MISCHDMKKGDVFMCEECGLELQVLSECRDAESPPDSCGCATDCSFECCGKPLTKK